MVHGDKQNNESEKTGKEKKEEEKVGQKMLKKRDKKRIEVKRGIWVGLSWDQHEKIETRHFPTKKCALLVMNFLT